MTIEPYNYNDEPSGRTDTLIQALEKIERLEKQLNIAIGVLSQYAEAPTRNLAKCALDRIEEIDGDYSHYWEQQIKELENKNKIFTYMGKPVDALTYIEKKIEYERKKIEYERKELEK